MRTIRFMKEIAACAAIVALCSGPGEARGQGTPISEASHPGSESEIPVSLVIGITPGD